MKAIKLIFLFSILLSCNLYGQSTKMRATIPSTALGNVSGADSTQNITTTVSYLYVKPTLSHKCGSIQYVATRYSASMGGTVSLQVSNDGINYTTMENFASDTLTISNAASSTGMILFPVATGLMYQYFRLKCTGASNDTATVRGYFHGRP